VCPPTGMHGLNLASEAVEPAASAPRNRGLNDHASTQRHDAAADFSRSSRLETTFRSSTTTFRLRTTVVESTLPAYFFNASPKPIRPVRFETPLLMSYTGRFDVPNPLSDVSIRQPVPSNTLSLPSGHLALGIKVPSLIPVREACRCDLPDFRSLPCNETFSNSSQDHRFRPATFHTAHCSINLLEPFSSCAET
jgi:hypothetical protein